MIKTIIAALALTVALSGGAEAAMKKMDKMGMNKCGKGMMMMKGKCVADKMMMKKKK